MVQLVWISNFSNVFFALLIVSWRKFRKLFKYRINSSLGVEAGFKSNRQDCEILILGIQQQSFGFFYAVTIDHIIEIFFQAIVDGLRHLVRRKLEPIRKILQG